MNLPEFEQADLVHLHIIHSGFFSLRHLPTLTAQKPTVWTIHDPWALTGHCIHPFDCERWKIGCGSCPDLKTHFSLKRDNTKILFSYKKNAYQKSDLDIVVASKWMRNMVEASPMFRNARLHQIPFGIDLNFFSPQNSGEARKRFGIPENALVISFRAEDSPYKGLEYITQALEKIDSKVPICLLTLSSANLVEKFSSRFQVIQLGWVHDQEIVRDVYRASDIFLMPSLAEAFGMMAVEAMACGKPTVVFEGTALPDITFAPEVGIAVPTRDVHALSQAIQRLIDNPEERITRGKKAREMAEKVYSETIHINAIVNLYRDIMKRYQIARQQR
jgi:glycosyltransferase involved in cell wall biosynthesis